MTCGDVAERLDAFVDGEFQSEPLLAVEIARHAAACPACETAIRDLTVLHAAIERAVQADVDTLDLTGVWPAVDAGIAHIDSRRAWRRRLRSAPMWGAAMAMAAGALFFVRTSDTPPTRVAAPARRNHAVIERIDTAGRFELRRDRKYGTTAILVSANAGAVAP